MRSVYKIIDWNKDMYRLFISEKRRLPKGTVCIVKRSSLLLLLDIIGGRLVKVHNGYNYTHFILQKSMFFFKAGALAYNTRCLSPITFDDKTSKQKAKGGLVGKMHLQMKQRKPTLRSKTIKIRRKK